MPTTPAPATSGPICTPIADSKVHEVDTPAPGEQCCRADEEQRADAALEAYRDDAGRTVTDLRGAGGSKDMLHGAAGHTNRERQGDDDQNEPEARHGMKHPKYPQQHDPGRQQRVLCGAPEMVR